MIKAPFNFVPLADRVFFPDWVDKISQDLPFRDGLDGYIEFDLVAKTPIFVRNGHSRDEHDNHSGEYKSSAKLPDGRYFLPGTSVKGAVRSVLEIMSLGKMRLDKNAMFAQREWNNKELYTIKDVNEQKRLRCGWLVYLKQEDRYVIRKSVSTPYRINHLRLDECLHTDVFQSHFQNKGKANEKFLNENQKIGDKEYDPKTATYKYKLLEEAGISRDDLIMRFSEDYEFATEYQENRVCASERGFQGVIVLTGQPDLAKWPVNGYERKMKDGKFYEFVFDTTIEREIELTAEEFEHFKFIYQDANDWEYAKEQLKSAVGLPVFFREIQTSRGPAIRDFGLAFLYKLPYEHSPYDLEQGGNRYKNHSAADADLADCLFGHVNEGREALRGRVRFSHFISDNAQPTDVNGVKLILNSPKASYYPIYIQQDGRNGQTTQYKTYNDGRLAGWKRYHVRDRVWTRPNLTGNSDVETTIYPLVQGSSFHGRAYFHNLKPVELGALLSAITFHGDEACNHQIGQGKPYGYGKVAVGNVRIEFDSPQPEFEKYGSDYYLALFEQLMTAEDRSWIDRMKPLFTIAHQEVDDNEVFKYMELRMKSESDPGINEFVSAKGEKQTDPHYYLRAYTELCRQSYVPQSYQGILEKDNHIVKELEEKIEVLKDIKERVRRYLTAKDTANNAMAVESFDKELKPLHDELSTDDNYSIYQERLDPKNPITGERVIDIADIAQQIDAIKNPPQQTLAEALPLKATSSGQVCNSIKQWKRTGNTITAAEVPVIADKWLELINNTSKKAKDREAWRDPKRWKSLLDEIGSEFTWPVMNLVVEKL